jgi:hypothetical protein
MNAISSVLVVCRGDMDLLQILQLCGATTVLFISFFLLTYFPLQTYFFLLTYISLLISSFLLISFILI